MVFDDCKLCIFSCMILFFNRVKFSCRFFIVDILIGLNLGSFIRLFGSC